MGDFHEKDPLAPTARPTGGPKRLAWSLNHVAKRIRQFEVPLTAPHDGESVITVQPAEATSASVVRVEIYIEPADSRAAIATQLT